MENAGILQMAYSSIRKYFEKSFPIAEEGMKLLEKNLVVKQLRKGQFFLREGEIAREGAFVASGFLRSYVVDDKGKEHIMQFAPENWWISDKSGLSGAVPSSFFIDAIEDSIILTCDINGHQTLLEKLPGYADSFRAGIQKRTIAKDNRLVASLVSDAQTRYNEFLETYAGIAQRIPQHMLASYLGITPETLSRIRKKASQKK